MERERLQAIESLQISNGTVKCQRCSHDIRIVGKLNKPHNDRVAILQKRIKWLENYFRGNNRASYINDIKALKQELAELLEEDAKADKLRSLPLYSCRITGWKFVCSTCYPRWSYLSCQKSETCYLGFRFHSFARAAKVHPFTRTSVVAGFTGITL
jgi:hypothetical protein